MNDQQQSRADALTDAIEQLNCLLDACEIGSQSERREARSAIHAFYRRALIAASPVKQPAAAPSEETIRFCPECGRLGDIPAGYEACCPDWSQARIVPKRFAELCAETFRLCVSQPLPQSGAASADERAALQWTAGVLQELVSGRWTGAKESDKVSIGSVTKTISQVLDMADVALGRAAASPAAVSLTDGHREAIQCAYDALASLGHSESGRVMRNLRGLLDAPQPAQADAPAEAREPDDLPVTFKGEPVTLSGAQLLKALDFIAPDRDTDQLESEVTIQYGEGHTGKGMYCWCTEYPDEGAIFLDGSIPATIGATDAGEAREPVTYDDVVSACEAHGIPLPVEAIEETVALINHFSAPTAASVARLTDDQRVEGSNPFAPTTNTQAAQRFAGGS